MRAPADGYTIGIVTPSNATNATLYEKLAFQFPARYHAGRRHQPLADRHLVHPSIPIRSVGELIAYAKANPGKLSMATGSNGTANQMTQGLFKMMARVDILDVPYRGEALALTDLLGGQVQGMFITLTSGLEFVRNGSLRALAVTTATRAEALPDVPTVADSCRVSSRAHGTAWALPATRRPKSSRGSIATSMRCSPIPRSKARFDDLGASTLVVSPAEFGSHVETETEKWGKVVKFLDLKPN